MHGGNTAAGAGSHQPQSRHKDSVYLCSGQRAKDLSEVFKMNLARPSRSNR
jgi:hypothetical protein